MSESMDTDPVEIQSSAEIETGQENNNFSSSNSNSSVLNTNNVNEVIMAEVEQTNTKKDPLEQQPISSSNNNNHTTTTTPLSSSDIKDEIMAEVEPIKSDTKVKVKQKQETTTPSNSTVPSLNDDINKSEEKSPPLKLVFDYDDDIELVSPDTNKNGNLDHVQGEDEKGQESNLPTSSFSGIKKRSNSSHQRNYRSSQEHLSACSNSEEEEEQEKDDDHGDICHQNNHDENNKEKTSRHQSSIENGDKLTCGGDTNEQHDDDGNGDSSSSSKNSLSTCKKLKSSLFKTTTSSGKTNEDENSNDNEHLLEASSSGPSLNDNNNTSAQNTTNDEPIFSTADEDSNNSSDWVAASLGTMDDDDDNTQHHENNQEGEDGDAEDNGDRENRRRRRQPAASSMQRLFYQVRALGNDDDDEVHFEEVRAGSDSDSSSLPGVAGDGDEDESDSSDCVLEDLDPEANPNEEAAAVEEATGSTEQKSPDSTGQKPAKKPKKKYEIPNVLKKPKPKYNWVAPKNIMMREMGYRANRQAQAAQIFRSKFYGSLYSVERLELMKKLDAHHGCVNCLNFNMAGNKLASGSDDLFIKIWNYGMGKVLASFHSGHRSNVFQAKFLPLVSLDTMIVSCARDNQVRLSELNSTGEMWSSRKLAQHRGAAHKLSVSPQTPHIVLSCGEDSVVYNIDVREDKAQRILSLRDRSKKVALYSIHQNPLFPYEFCVSGRDEYVRIYDSRKLSAVSVPVERGNEETREATNENDSTPLKKFCPHHLIDSRHKSNVTAAMYNYNGREIVASYNDENIYLFDATHSDGADCVKVYEGHRNSATIKGINFFGDKSQFIVSGSDCGHVFIWDKETESIVNFFRADENGVVNCLEPHPTCPILATSGLDDDVKIWIPSKEKDPVMGPANSDLASTVYKNLKARKEELERQPESMDGRIIQALWNHIRQANRERRTNPNSREERRPQIIRFYSLNPQRDAGLQLSDSDDSPTYNDDDEDDESSPRGVECTIQ